MWKVIVMSEFEEERFFQWLEDKTICTWICGRESPMSFIPSSKESFPYIIRIDSDGTLSICGEDEDDSYLWFVSSFMVNLPSKLKKVTMRKAKQTINDGSHWVLHCHDVEHIWVNRKKLTTAVKFDDNKIVKVKLSEGDEWNVYNAVAVAIAEHVYGSNSAFKKMIDKKMEIQDKGETHFNIAETLRGVGEEVAKALAGIKDGK